MNRRRERGRISYAELGINQLGAVYEGLLSYTGFFVEEILVPGALILRENRAPL